MPRKRSKQQKPISEKTRSEDERIVESYRLTQIEDLAIKALLSMFEQKAQLVGERLRETSDRMRLVQVNKTHTAIQKKQAELGRRVLLLQRHAAAGKSENFARELDRILQIQCNIKRDMILFDGQLDEILGRIDKL